MTQELIHIANYVIAIMTFFRIVYWINGLKAITITIHFVDLNFSTEIPSFIVFRIGIYINQIVLLKCHVFFDDEIDKTPDYLYDKVRLAFSILLDKISYFDSSNSFKLIYKKAHIFSK